jgi:hypothetical protein
MKIVLSIVLSAVMLGVSVPIAQAHHSFPATYLVDKEVTLEGELVAFMFRNPHAFVHLNVKQKSGEVIRYAIEWGGASQLNQQGITRATFKPGDHVIITGNPGRNVEDRRVRMRRIERPADGFKWGFKGEDFQ